MNQKGNGKIVLFCLPYAGGSATVYNKFNQYLDKNIEMVPIEYAGRGKRIKEEFYTDVSSAAEDVYNEAIKHMNDCEFAFWGHSMGSVIAYEVCSRIRKNCGREPLCIFVSGRYPPHIKKQEKKLHILSDENFKEEILKIGGTPKEVFDNKELAQLFVPILRADYRIIEDYTMCGNPVKFKSQIIVLSGKKDKIVNRSELFEWQKYSESNISMYEFDGGHFFINNFTKEISNIINNALIKR